MKSRGIKLVWLLVWLICGLVGGNVVAKAQELTVEVVKLEGQVLKNQQSIDTKASSGKKMTVAYTVRAKELGVVELDTAVVNAGLDQEGKLYYDPRYLPMDGSKLDLAAFVEIEQAIKVPAGDSFSGTLTIEAPKEAMDGVVMGAVLFFEKGSDRVLGTLPIRLTVGDSLPKAELVLQGLSVVEKDGEQQLAATIKNPAANNEAGLSFRFEMYDSSQKLMAERIIKQVDFPPQTDFVWDLALPMAQMKKGAYQVKVRLDTEEGSKSELTQGVKVTESQGVKQLVLSDSEEKREVGQLKWGWLAGACVLLVGAGLGVRSHGKSVSKSKGKQPSRHRKSERVLRKKAELDNQKKAAEKRLKSEVKSDVLTEGSLPDQKPPKKVRRKKREDIEESKRK